MRPWDADYDVIQELGALLDDHIEWYDGIMALLVSYHQLDNTERQRIWPRERPAHSLTDYMDKHSERGCLPPKVLEGLNSQYESFLNSADRVLKECGKRKGPGHETITTFREHFVNFNFLLNKMRDQMSLSSFGYDPYTGLKNKRLGYIDLKKELERKLRHEMPFTILMMRIVNLHEITELFGAVVSEKVVRYVVETIENKLRIFDDMYRMDTNEFLISVKVTDVPGAVLFGKRIQTFFQKEDNKIVVEEYDIPLKLGFVVGEPQVEESVSGLLDNMREDFEQMSDNGGVIQHIEIAPIEKYIRSSGPQKESKEKSKN